MRRAIYDLIAVSLAGLFVLLLGFYGLVTLAAIGAL